MLVYRVFPWLANAKPGEAGHPTYAHPDQGAGRWDNPDLYLALYVASTPSGAIGEAFAHLRHWSVDMLAFPAIPGSSRSLAVYRIDEDSTPMLDLDDPKTLASLAIRPSELVARNRPHTQDIARSIHGDGRWSGISWWSTHRPQWAVHVLFGAAMINDFHVESLHGHAALIDASTRLAKSMNADLLTA